MPTPKDASSLFHGDDELLTPDELAALLKRSKRWVYDAAATRTLPSFKIGHQLRFRRSEVEQWLFDHRTERRS